MRAIEKAWAEEEFGGAVLGDRRRNDRLVRLAAQVAMSPAGTVTSVLSESCEREGAFRFLESNKVSADAVASAAHRSAMERSRSYSSVYVAVDGSSLHLTDRVGGRDVGAVGAFRKGGRGLIVLSALAVSPDGTPLGLCGQRWWARKKRSSKSHHHSRHALQGETGHVVQLLAQLDDNFRETAPEVRPWYQLDRGYDCWPVFQLAQERSLQLTVRACYNRRLRSATNSEQESYLMTTEGDAPVLGHYLLEVPARDGAKSRVATMLVRACTVVLQLTVGAKRRQCVPMQVVYVREQMPYAGEKPIEWTLLTTAPVSDVEQALQVVDGYATRWRIEEFHRAWKSGVCNVEDTQLRARESIIKWATILASVAARAVRLAYLAREKPDICASEELSPWEIKAAIVLKKPKGITLDDQPTLAQVVRWIADLGGYTGKSSGGPPGTTVIARGLAKVELLAEGLQVWDKMR